MLLKSYQLIICNKALSNRHTENKEYKTYQACQAMENCSKHHNSVERYVTAQQTKTLYKNLSNLTMSIYINDPYTYT